MYKSKQKGSAAIEMAIILLPMMIIFLGITEYGRALYYYNGLAKATRGAARHLSMQSYQALANPLVTDTQKQRIKTRADQAANLVLCGKLNCVNMDPLVPGLLESNISVCYPNKTVLYPTASCAVMTKTLDGILVPYDMISIEISGYVFKPLFFPSFSFGRVRFSMAAGTG